MTEPPIDSAVFRCGLRFNPKKGGGGGEHGEAPEGAKPLGLACADQAARPAEVLPLVAPRPRAAGIHAGRGD